MLGVGSCLARMKGTVTSSREVVAHFLHSEAFIGPRLSVMKMLGSRNSQESFPKTLMYLFFFGKDNKCTWKTKSKEFETCICYSWKVSTSRKALPLPAGTFARSFPPIFMLIHLVACILCDMPIFFPPSCGER